ncbi:MAG: dihydrodipicolinate synthase family protein [Cognatishimia sp.]
MNLAATNPDVRAALRQISGVSVTAYLANGEVNPQTTAKISQRIASAGVKNVISAGNTGEFFSLSIDEVRKVTEIITEAIDHKAIVTASVGRSLREAKALSNHAKSSGADCIMVHYPTDPFASPAQKVDYFCAIAEHADLPVVAYLRSDEASVAEMTRLAEHENIVAIKYANTNLIKFSDVVRASAHTDTIWICGLAEGWAAPFYALGATGFTSGLVNVFPKISLGIYEALENGDYFQSRELVGAIAEFEGLRTLLNNGTNVTVVKEALELTFEKVGDVRLPGVSRLSDKHHQQLAKLVVNLERLERSL